VTEKPKAPPLEFKPLQRDCPCGPFTCGHDAIDKWLKEKAWKRHSGYRVRVRTAHLKGNRNPVGFYALVLNSEPVDHLDRAEKNAGWEGPSFPCVHLWYLAVLQRMQRQGVGRLVLMDAIESVYEISQYAGVYGMTLNAIDERAVAFYNSLGFRKYGPDSRTPKMLLPIFTIVELFEKEPVS